MITGGPPEAASDETPSLADELPDTDPGRP